MINANEMKSVLSDYKRTCTKEHVKPSRRTFASFIGVSVQTIHNAIKGMYNGIYYSLKPCCTRCFDNKSFEVLRDFFSENGCDNEEK